VQRLLEVDAAPARHAANALAPDHVRGIGTFDVVGAGGDQDVERIQPRRPDLDLDGGTVRRRLRELLDPRRPAVL
jgi:hypothetical protein